MIRKPSDTSRKGAPEWLEARASYRGNDCLLWPFSLVRGYGHLKYEGQMQYSHRVMCLLAHGEAPADKQMALHRCGNRRCCNPGHLYWGNNSANQRDRRGHGTKNMGRGRQGLVTAEQVREIRAKRGLVTQDELAKQFGRCRGTIQYWQRTTHDPPPPGTSKATEWRRRKREQQSAGN